MAPCRPRPRVRFCAVSGGKEAAALEPPNPPADAGIGKLVLLCATRRNQTSHNRGSPEGSQMNGLDVLLVRSG